MPRNTLGYLHSALLQIHLLELCVLAEFHPEGQGWLQLAPAALVLEFQVGALG